MAISCFDEVVGLREKFFVRVVGVLELVYGIVADRVDVEGVINEDVNMW